MKVAILVGNPKPASRTLDIATRLVARALPAAKVHTVDLAGCRREIFDWPSSRLSELQHTVATSDVAVIASPTYKGSYTGLLKAFLDRYEPGGLAGLVALPMMTGAGLDHALAPEVHLRPLLVELGATVPTRSLFVTMASYPEIDEQLSAWVETSQSLVLAAARVAPAFSGIYTTTGSNQ